MTTAKAAHPFLLDETDKFNRSLQQAGKFAERIAPSINDFYEVQDYCRATCGRQRSIVASQLDAVVRSLCLRFVRMAHLSPDWVERVHMHFINTLSRCPRGTRKANVDHVALQISRLMFNE